MKVNHSVVIFSVIGSFLIWMIWLVVSEKTEPVMPSPRDGIHKLE